MRKLFLVGGLQVAWLSGLSQTLPFDVSEGVHVQPTNLVVRWEARKHPWPKTLWTYRVLPREFPPVVISNLMALGSFTGKDRTYSGTNGLVFGHPYAAPYLDICFTAGTVDYDGRTQHYSPTNLANNVPGTNQLLRLSTNFLAKIGIGLSEVAKRENGQPKLWWPDDSTDHTLYFVGDTTITNIESRRVFIYRALDGVEFHYGAGDCEVEFGEHSRVVRLQLDWRAVEHDKLYAAAMPDRIIEWIRQGKAYQKHMLVHGFETIVDWPTVKSLTVKTAKAYYDGECFFARASAGQPILPSWVRPYAEITGTVDTGTTNLNVEIVCPVIDETQSPDVKHSRWSGVRTK
jgi:hypothetical protein